MAEQTNYEQILRETVDHLFGMYVIWGGIFAKDAFDRARAGECSSALAFVESRAPELVAEFRDKHKENNPHPVVNEASHD